jgi:hypothetical protein
MSLQFFPLVSNGGFDRSLVMENFMITPRCRRHIMFLHMEKLFALFRAINRVTSDACKEKNPLAIINAMTQKHFQG